MLLKTTWREKEGGSFSELANYSSSMYIKDLDTLKLLLKF